jgi:hypothetical protein
VVFALGGQWLTRKWVRQLMGEPPGHNDIVSYYLGAFGVFYGITLGLISVGAWEDYGEVASAAGHEAAALGALYRDVGAYPAPKRTELSGLVRDYVRGVIEKDWPEQRQGVTPQGGPVLLTRLHEALAAFEPQTMGQQVIHAEALRQFNKVSELSRERLELIDIGLPRMLWWVVFLGAALNIALMWLFVATKPLVHDLLTASLAALLGLLIFLMLAVDHPFRGDFAIGTDAYEHVFNSLMK